MVYSSWVSVKIGGQQNMVITISQVIYQRK